MASVEGFEFSEKAAARILGVTDRTLRNWRKAKLITCYRLPGGRIRYSMTQLIDFQRSCLVASSKPRGPIQ